MLKLNLSQKQTAAYPAITSVATPNAQKSQGADSTGNQTCVRSFENSLHKFDLRSSDELLSLILKSDRARKDKIARARANWHEEWTKGSCNSAGIVAANAKWLEGDDAFEAIAGAANLDIELKLSSSGFKDEEAHRDYYSFLEDGGVFMSGQDPLNNWERMSWEQSSPSARAERKTAG